MGRRRRLVERNLWLENRIRRTELSRLVFLEVMAYGPRAIAKSSQQSNVPVTLGSPSISFWLVASAILASFQPLSCLCGYPSIGKSPLMTRVSFPKPMPCYAQISDEPSIAYAMCSRLYNPLIALEALCWMKWSTMIQGQGPFPVTKGSDSSAGRPPPCCC
jgi:hypothetical protein